MFSARKKFLLYKKSKKVTKIQSLFRRKQAIKLALSIKKRNNAIKIQKRIRVVLAKKKTRKQREIHAKYKFIQIFWKFRFLKKMKSLKKIQIHFRRFQVFFNLFN